MKLGIFMMPLHPPSRDLHEVFLEDQEVILHADRVGFDEVWLGEHYSCVAEPIASPLMFLATLIRETKKIRLCTGVLNLPQHHPVIVAAHAALFDHLCEGRFTMGIGPGGLVSDFELFKTLDGAERFHRTQEAIDIILKLWAAEPPFAFTGKYWDIRLEEQIVPELGIGTMPKPYQRPHPPLAVSAMSPNSSSVKVAAARGWSVVSGAFIPVRANLATHWEQMQRGWAETGAAPDGSKWKVVRAIFVADSDSEAQAYVDTADSQLHFFFDYVFRSLKRFNATGIAKDHPDMPDSELTPAYAIERRVIAGSPDTVAERILELREEAGPFDTIIMQGLDWDRPALHRRSMELMAREVMPRLNRAMMTADALAVGVG